MWGENNLFIPLPILVLSMTLVFNVEKMERMLEERGKIGFGGLSVRVSEEEMRQIIAELKVARRV